MQLLDDDMDELFRNAASQYPLRTDGADWDAISGRLQSGNTPGAAGSPVRSNKWLWAGIILLLTFIFFIIYAPVLENGKLPVKSNNNNITTSVIAVTTVKNETPAPVREGSITSEKVENSIAIAGNKTPVTVATHPVTNNSITITGNKMPVTVITHPAIINGIAVTGKKLPVAVVTNQVTANGIDATENKQPVAENTIPATDISNTVPVNGNPVPATTVPAITMATPADSIVHKADTTTPAPAKVKAPAKSEKGFYAGIIASPDISTVKMQRVSRIGYGFGIIAGYRISNHFAVETGLLWDRKNYYSTGSNFSTKKIPIPSNMKILNVDGYCNMFEIPVNVRYFISKSWYANVGMSSYLMKKEDYAYKYSYGGSGTYDQSWSYKNASRNWFSVVHVGVGYEHQIGVLGKLRVEPYVKIPARGVGIGELPLTSFGLNLGITKSIR